VTGGLGEAGEGSGPTSTLSFQLKQHPRNHAHRPPHRPARAVPGTAHFEAVALRRGRPGPSPSPSPAPVCRRASGCHSHSLPSPAPARGLAHPLCPPRPHPGPLPGCGRRHGCRRDGGGLGRDGRELGRQRSCAPRALGSSRLLPRGALGRAVGPGGRAAPAVCPRGPLRDAGWD